MEGIIIYKGLQFFTANVNMQVSKYKIKVSVSLKVLHRPNARAYCCQITGQIIKKKKIAFLSLFS